MRFASRRTGGESICGVASKIRATHSNLNRFLAPIHPMLHTFRGVAIVQFDGECENMGDDTQSQPRETKLNLHRQLKTANEYPVFLSNSAARRRSGIRSSSVSFEGGSMLI